MPYTARLSHADRILLSDAGRVPRGTSQPATNKSCSQLEFSLGTRGNDNRTLKRMSYHYTTIRRRIDRETNNKLSCLSMKKASMTKFQPSTAAPGLTPALAVMQASPALEKGVWARLGDVFCSVSS